MKKLENMEENEMASKIDSILILLKIIGSLVIKKWHNPLKLARMTKLALTLKNKAQNLKNVNSSEQQIENTVELAEVILNFRRKNTEEFEMLLDTLEEVIKNYKNNPDIKKEINNLIK